MKVIANEFLISSFGNLVRDLFSFFPDGNVKEEGLTRFFTSLIKYSLEIFDNLVHTETKSLHRSSIRMSIIILINRFWDFLSSKLEQEYQLHNLMQVLNILISKVSSNHLILTPGDKIFLNRSINSFLEQIDEYDWTSESKDIVKNLIKLTVKELENTKSSLKNYFLGAARLLQEEFFSILPFSIDQFLEFSSKGLTRKVFIIFNQLLIHWLDNIVDDDDDRFKCLKDLYQELLLRISSSFSL